MVRAASWQRWDSSKQCKRNPNYWFLRDLWLRCKEYNANNPSSGLGKWHRKSDTQLQWGKASTHKGHGSTWLGPLLCEQWARAPAQGTPQLPSEDGAEVFQGVLCLQNCASWPQQYSPHQGPLSSHETSISIFTWDFKTWILTTVYQACLLSSLFKACTTQLSPVIQSIHVFSPQAVLSSPLNLVSIILTSQLHWEIFTRKKGLFCSSDFS